MPIQRKHWFSRYLAGALAAVTLATLIVVALRPRPVPVDLATVTAGPMRVTVDEEGRTRVRDVYTVLAPVAGRVLPSPLNAGDRVEAKRKVLAVIEETIPAFLDARARREIDAQLAAALASVELASAEVRQAEAEQNFANSELERARQLIRTKVIADRTLERAKVDAETKAALVARAKANLELRRREYDSVRAKLTVPVLHPQQAVRDETACCVSILAPVSGRVLKRIHESEKVVAPGSPLIEIGDLNDMEIAVDLLSTDAVKLRAGADATVEGWGGSQVLQATVRRIEPAGFAKISALGIEEQRVKVILDFGTPLIERDTLGHDYRVLLRIDVWSNENVLQVPLSALFRRGERWAVFVANSGRAHVRLIELGQRNNDTAQVVTGLAPGEMVILHPSDRIGDGVRIVVRTGSPAQPRVSEALPAAFLPSTLAPGFR